MHASYLSLAIFAAAVLTAPIADNTISGSGGVTVNGQPFPPGSCVINGVITPEAQCPTVPSSGIVCVADGNLVTGAACAGNPNAIDLGPPAPVARLAKRDISGSGGVTVNGQPFPADSCVVDGKITPIAQCPAIPTTGLICVVNGQLLTGDACIGQPGAIDQGPPAPAARLAKRDISGSGGVFVNGQPFPPNSCVINGVITPEAQCPTVPSSGIICFVEGKLVTGAACAGNPNAIDLGPPATPPARLAKRAGPIQSFVFDCKGWYAYGTPNFEKVNQACLIDPQTVLYFYCTAAELPSLKCRNPQPVPGKPFPYPVNT
ncbi:hypothetical protein MMC29_004394 [Sticta canariensis]|nr:hypothetical protein [Sticta canariensis]